MEIRQEWRHGKNAIAGVNSIEDRCRRQDQDHRGKREFQGDILEIELEQPVSPTSCVPEVVPLDNKRARRQANRAVFFDEPGVSDTLYRSREALILNTRQRSRKPCRGPQRSR